MSDSISARYSAAMPPSANDEISEDLRLDEKRMAILRILMRAFARADIREQLRKAGLGPKRR